MRSSVSSRPHSPGPERPAAAVSTAGKSATRIRTSDELGAGPFSPRSSVADFPLIACHPAAAGRPGYPCRAARLRRLVAPLLSAGAGLPGRAAAFFAAA